jgi:LAGLIDADG endonuclease
MNTVVLTHFIGLFGVGVVEPHSKEGVFTYAVNGLHNCAHLFTYFDTHSLHTKKANSYKLWRELHARLIAKEHLNPNLRPLLKKLASKINK